PLAARNRRPSSRDARVESGRPHSHSRATVPAWRSSRQVFSFALPFQCGHAILEFGCQECPRVGVYDFAQLARFAWCELPACDGCGDCCKAIGCVFRLAQRGQRKEDRTVFSRWRNPIETKTNSGKVTILGQLNGLARDCLRFTVEQDLNGQGRLVAGALRAASRIAALSRLEGSADVLFLRCIFSASSQWSVPSHLFRSPCISERSQSFWFSF